MRKKSGEVNIETSDWLSNLFYRLLESGLPAGDLESIVKQVEEDRSNGFIKTICCDNGWIANYAKHLADRLDKKS